MTCLVDGIPGHLHAQSKALDNLFSLEEKLYRRYPKKDREGENTLEISGKIKLSVFEYPISPNTIQGLSCNRSKYSLPTDVLYDIVNGNHFHDTYSVMEATIGEIEKFIRKHPISDYHFYLTCEHVPMPCMYPHSEVWIHRTKNESGVFYNANLNIKVIKAELRKHFSNIFKHVG